MANIGPSLTLLAIVFGLHIVLINIDLGLAILIPIMKRIGEKNNNPLYVREAKRYMRYFAIVYASAGVFATAFTVFLLTFFPEFLWLGGVVLVYPFGFAVLFVGIRFAAISSYWYTWDKLDPKYHFYIGLVLASTSFFIPYFFRSVFAFFNSPVGVENLSPLQMNWVDYYFANPSFLPLYLKSLFGAMAVTFFMLTMVYLVRYYKKVGEAEENKSLAKTFLLLGIWMLFFQVFFGAWYLAAVSMTSPYKFSNIAGSWFGIDPQGIDLSLVFALKLFLVALQVFVIFYLLTWHLRKGALDYDAKYVKWSLLSLGPSAILTIFIGELLNGLSQVPYFIAQPSLESALEMINMHKSINPLADLIDLYAITIFAIVPLMLAMIVLIYYLLSGYIGENNPKEV